MNRLFDRHIGGPNRPVFFDVDETYPALNEVARHYEDIRRELDGVLASRESLPRYHDLDEAQYNISGRLHTHRNWKVFMLYAMGFKPESNRRQCPKTCAVLDEIPNLWQAFFSILDPRKSIPAHEGPYKGYLRYHLGLRIPDENPPSIRVKDQVHTWQEGRGVLFDDSWEHEVTNESDELRAILIVDVMRPLPFLLHSANLLVNKIYLRGYRRKLRTNLAAHDQSVE
jgi:aspartyl/asparaginyl beta-hydroxylase (cupin superfamily)